MPTFIGMTLLKDKPIPVIPAKAGTQTNIS
jgi:hypothetical protein